MLVLGREVDGVLHGLQQHAPVSALWHPPLLLADLTKHSEHLESGETWHKVSTGRITSISWRLPIFTCVGLLRLKRVQLCFSVSPCSRYQKWGQCMGTSGLACLLFVLVPVLPCSCHQTRPTFVILLIKLFPTLISSVCVGVWRSSVAHCYAL